MNNVYLLNIDPNSVYDLDLLKKQLDICNDWTRPFACTYLLYTTADDDRLYQRFKKALPDNKFLINKLNLQEDQYNGWLKPRTWDRIKEFKAKE